MVRVYETAHGSCSLVETVSTLHVTALGQADYHTTPQTAIYATYVHLLQIKVYHHKCTQKPCLNIINGNSYKHEILHTFNRQHYLFK